MIHAPRSSRRRSARAGNAIGQALHAAVPLGMVLMVAACDGTDPASAPVAQDAATSRLTPQAASVSLEGETEGGHYRIRVRPAVQPVPLHRMHDWIVGIELLGDASKIPTAVTFDGGMPSHGHGFVTQPRVTRNLGGGEFLVEGVKFHMPGEWVLRVTVASGSASEGITLPLAIGP